MGLRGSCASEIGSSVHTGKWSAPRQFKETLRNDRPAISKPVSTPLFGRDVATMMQTDVLPCFTPGLSDRRKGAVVHTNVRMRVEACDK